MDLTKTLGSMFRKLKLSRKKRTPKVSSLDSSRSMSENSMSERSKKERSKKRTRTRTRKRKTNVVRQSSLKL